MQNISHNNNNKGDKIKMTMFREERLDNKEEEKEKG